jgi:hypothetical protein
MSKEGQEKLWQGCFRGFRYKRGVAGYGID